ncbi:hypothetical protein EC988_009138, partial [Linderina pennispora]
MSADYSSPVAAVLMDEQDLKNAPDSILGIKRDAYPYFSGPDAHPPSVSRATYSYFPYWIDCGFYSYAEERASARADDFQPSCKIGDIAVAGVSEYMRRTPQIPDLNSALHLSVEDIASMATFDGAPTYQSDHSSGTDAVRGKASSMRQEVSAAGSFSHGRVVRGDAQRSDRRDMLLKMFAKFDREAILGGSSDEAAVDADGALGDERLG